MPGYVYVILAIVTLFFQAKLVLWAYREANRRIDEQCQDVTDKKTIQAFRRKTWAKGWLITVTFTVFLLLAFLLFAYFST